jgi:putative copper export protein
MGTPKMGNWTLQFAEALGAHPHVLDGGLGRALAYFGLALCFGIRVWPDLVRDVDLKSLVGLRVSAAACGLVGMLIALNATAVELAAPFRPQGQDLGIATLAELHTVLLGTTFGNAWLGYAACLVLGTVFGNYRPVAWAAVLGMGLALALAGHAGEYGWSGPALWIDLLHLTFALMWLGALALLVAGRLGKTWAPERDALLRFSRIALPMFGAILLTGLVRLYVQYENQGGYLGGAYLLMLGLKLCAVLGVVVAAAGLRRQLRDSGDLSWERRYDNGLSSEVFFAALVVFATSLLTQLPPT